MADYRQTAFINESLRLNSSFTDRFPRDPLEPVPYKQWMIPTGVCKSCLLSACMLTCHQTSVGAMPWLLNHSSEVFPEPHAFRPERWPETRERQGPLTKYLVTFSKAARGCAGIK